MNLSPKQSERASGIQVIARAAQILRVLAKHPEGMSLSQIAKDASLARSTVQRIIGALQTERFVISVTSAGRVRLGPGLVELAASVRNDVREEVRPYLEKLCEVTGETVDLAVLDRDEVLFIDQIASTHRLQAVSSVGTRFPLYSSANGKAILAKFSDDQIRDYLPLALKPFTPHTITSMDELKREIEDIRLAGVAYDREEHTEGICAVGAAFRTSYGELAAVTVPTPATRFYGHESELAEVLKRTVDAIVRHLAVEEIQ